MQTGTSGRSKGIQQLYRPNSDWYCAMSIGISPKDKVWVSTEERSQSQVAGKSKNRCRI